MRDVCVAIKAHQGWVNTVAVLLDAGEPLALHVQRVELVDGSDRETLEPYHVAGGWSGLTRVPAPANPAAVVRRGRRKQTLAARASQLGFHKTLEGQGLAWRRAVVLTSRGRLGDLDHILGSHAHIHVAEGEAIRAATRAALRQLDIDSVDQDEKSIAAEARGLLDGRDADQVIKALRPAGAPSWAREERTLALGAWLHGR